MFVSRCQQEFATGCADDICTIDPDLPRKVIERPFIFQGNCCATPDMDSSRMKKVVTSLKSYIYIYIVVVAHAYDSTSRRFDALNFGGALDSIQRP